MNRLRELRKSLGMTQTQLAELLGIKQSSYASIESGRVELTERNAILLSDKLNVNKEWLLTGLGDIRKGISATTNEIEMAAMELLNEGKPVGSGVPYEFVQALLEERKLHDMKELELIQQNRELINIVKNTLLNMERKIAPHAPGMEDAGCATVSGMDVKG